MAGVTPYPELDALLADLVGSVRAILGATFVGAYVQGSFALGAGDLLAQVIADRALGWDPGAPPRPGSLEWAYEFAAYAETFATA